MVTWMVKMTAIEEIQDADTFTDGFSIDPTVIHASYYKKQYKVTYVNNASFPDIIGAEGLLSTLATATPAVFKAQSKAVVTPTTETLTSTFSTLPAPTGTVFEHAGSWKPSSATILFNDDGVAETELHMSAFDEDWLLDNVDATAKFFEPSPHQVRLLLQDKKDGKI